MYFLALDARQVGPLSLEQLRAGWKDGTYPPDVLYWQDGMADWQPLESMRLVLEQPPAVIPAAAPMIIAGFWRRLGAFLIDVLLIGIVGFGSGYFLFNFYMSLGLGGLLIGLAVATAYFGLLNSSLGGGQTFGKRLFGTRVVDGAGNPIPVGRSILRYLILAFPFFLNKAVTDGLVANLWVGGVLMIPVVAGFAAFTYLLIFNRRTRQLVHDLILGTFVVRTSSPRPALAPHLWKGHLVVVAVLCALVLAVSGLAPFVAHLPFFQGMLAVRQAVMSSPDVRVATVSGGTTFLVEGGQTEKTSILLILVHLKAPPASPELRASQIALQALQSDSSASGYDRINVSISFGYDIGIASGVVTDQYSHTPAEWKQIASPSAASP